MPTWNSKLVGGGTWIVAGLVAVAIGFGLVVVQRNVLLARPQGDLGVFLRAGWEVREGGRQLYQVTDEHGWHYHYPPLYAILMSPLAQPPRRERAVITAAGVGLLVSPSPAGALTGAAVLATLPSRPAEGWFLPYPVAVVLVYLFNLGCLAVAVHLLARTAERLAPRGAHDRSPLAWWRLRLVPVATCLPAIGLTLVRGQVQCLLLLLLAGFAVCLVRRRSFRAGLLLAAAASIKVFPIYLLLLPLWRRDGRCVAGCVLGLTVGLVGVPAVVLGPETTAALCADRWRLLEGIFTRDAVDHPAATELLAATANQSQSFQVILHKLAHYGSPDIPSCPAPLTRLAHWLCVLALVVAVLRGGDARREAGAPLLLRTARLMLAMVVSCPVCHLHYLTLGVPLALCLTHSEAVEDGRSSDKCLLTAFFLAAGLPMLPGLAALRDVGVATAAVVTLCLVTGRQHGSAAPAEKAAAAALVDLPDRAA